MSVLLNYKKKNSFTGQELVDAVNSLLSEKHLQPFNRRSLRFYVAESIIPPPIGPTKFARYGYEHLLLILATRMFQYTGEKLENIQVKLRGKTPIDLETLEKKVKTWIGVKDEIIHVAESTEIYHNENSTSKNVYRIPVGSHCVVEVDANTDLREQLRILSQKVQTLLSAMD